MKNHLLIMSLINKSNLANFVYFLVIIIWLSTNFVESNSNDDRNDEFKVNLTEKYSKCLLPNQKTNFSLDGLTNCTCADGYDFDPVFNRCFENKCDEICKNMSCHILKHDIFDFEYYCYCESGFDRIDPYYPIGCIAIDQKFTKLIESSKETNELLPINPFLAEKLNCSQTYELTSSGKYECRCFNGYKWDPKTKTCRKFGNYVNYCKDNQILALDEYDQIVCRCKPGFGGQNCEHNFCHWPIRSEEEKRYFEESIGSFCTVPQCRLAFDKFKCSCAEPFSRETKDGGCQLVKDCTENQILDKCGKDKLCKLNTKNKQKTFDCRCPIEMTTNQSNDLSSNENCKQLEEKGEYCLAGYLPNPEINKPRIEYRQKCIKGYSTFNFTFQIRFDLALGNNSEWMLGNYFELEKDIDLDRIPRSLLNDFVNYKDSTLIYTMDKVINKEIVKRKLEFIIENAFKNQMFNSNFHNFHKECYLIPEIEFDYHTFSLLRLVQNLVDVNLQVTCKTYTTGELFSNFFKFYFQQNYFNSNYLEFRNVGYVDPESISYH